MAFFTDSTPDNCSKCGLYKGINSPKMGVHGKGKTGVLVLGQSPGATEDRQGRPFVGRAGDVVRKFSGKHGFDFDRDFWVQNAFRCHPKKKKANWSIECKCCHGYLQEDIERLRPWLVVAMGKEAIQAALWNFGNLSVGQYQGLLVPMVEQRYWVYCTNHPAALLHERQHKSKYEWVFDYDWEQVAEIVADRENLVPAEEMREEWDLDNYKVVTDFEEARAELEELYHHDFFRDYENYPLKPYNKGSEVLSFSAAYQTAEGIHVFSVPWKRKYWTPPQRRKLLHAWRRACENPETRKIAHNHKHELQWDRFLGIEARGVLECTAIRQHLLREKRGTAGLKFQVFTRWGCRYAEGMERYKEDMRKAPEPDIYIYNCHDSRFGLKLWLEQEEERYPKFDGNYELLLEGNETLTRMEITGARVDTELVTSIGSGYESDGSELEWWLLNHEWARIWKRQEVKVGEDEEGNDLYEVVERPELNLNSGQQVGELLFEVLKLPGGVKTETQWSTSKDNLAVLATEHEWIRKWQEAGRLGRFKGTFVDGHIFSNLYDDGLLHGSYSLTIPETYRSSMDHPNLQNVVKRDEEGKKLRRAFVPLHEGWEIGSFDYEQHEVVAYCHNTQDRVMVDAVLSGHDFHREYAARLLRKKEREVTDRERDMVGKTGFVFPILYGAYPKTIFEGLQKDGYRVAGNHVTRVWQEFRRQFSATIEWQGQLLEFFEEHGYVESLLGFRRRAPLTANEIINFPSQSIAFHYLLYGLHKADERMLEDEMEARPVKQIHDEAEFHYPVKEREKVFEIVKESFEDLPWAWTKTPPVKLGGKMGPNWYDMEKIKL